MSLPESLCQEIDRVKEIIEVYEAIPGGAGAFAAACMKHDIDIAEKARMHGDVAQMILSYSALKEYEL